MEVPTYLLFVLGLLGATDIAVYHSFAHGIRQHRDCRAELVVHSLRGPTYAALFVLVPNFALHGAWFWCLIALFAFDVSLSIVDFSLEGQSRRSLGGLPTGEYVLHVILAMLFGALVTAAAYGSGSWATLPTQVTYEPAAVPIALRLVMMVMAALVLYSGIQDSVAAVRLRTKDGQAAHAAPG
jgi:hypothetical protein